MQIDDKRYLYRIMPFKHVIDMFESREIHFASPTCWDDPYERVLKHRGTPWTFAQCWCTRAVSDALWRIYSTDHTSVRIRTSQPKLAALGTRIKATYHGTFRIDDVFYDSAKAVNSEIEKIASELQRKFSMKRALDSLFLKRDAFDYESEVRVVAYIKPQPDLDGVLKETSLRFKIDPHSFIESILFDPRADPTYVKVASHYLKNALKYSGKIGRSALYRASEIHISDDTL